MKIKSQKKQRLRALGIVLVVLIPMISISIPVVRVTSIYQDLIQHSFDLEPDPSTFQQINYSRLSEVANWTDERFKQYHMPLNMCSPTYFTDDSYTEVDHYKYGDNEALRTGIAYTAWVHKYLAAKREGNRAMEADALQVLYNLTHGMSMLMRVPNGGLGSEYPGKLARGYSPPDARDVGAYYFEEHPKHFNGTGKYSQWKWRDYTSNDEHGGYYMFLAMALKYIEDPWILDMVYKIVDQLANYMVQNRFLGIAAHGGPTGVDQNPRVGEGGFWKAVLLKMASMCYPEKYRDLYYYFMNNEFGYFHNKMSGAQETVANYFAYNFAHAACFGFLVLEGIETNIGKRFYEGYLNSLRKNVENHRNPYFNAIYLALRAELYGSQQGDFPVLEHDVEDQLMRLEQSHFPDRAYEAPPTPDEYDVIPELEKWEQWLEEHPLGDFYSIFLMDVDIEKKIYTKPLTADLRPGITFLWAKNPFYEPRTLNRPLLENAGISFMAPYWIARAHGFINATGIKQAGDVPFTPNPAIFSQGGL